MAFDPRHDEQRLRWAGLGVGLVLLGALAAAGYRGSSPAWRGQQRPLGGARRGIVEQRACDGTVDRCLTCHQAPRGPIMALPGHAPEAVGCTACHGGTGRALSVEAAHAAPGMLERDALLVEPYRSASCARCHVPGAVAGTERLVRGARLYVALGCTMCHALAAGARGGWDVGPDLRSAGRRTPAELRASLLEPKQRFLGTVMPSFANSFNGRDPDLQDLLVYLQSLPLPAACANQTRPAALAAAACATCHAGPQGKASGRFTHRCVHLVEQASTLACRNCHADVIPASTGGGRDCPLASAQRAGCVVCHGGLR